MLTHADVINILLDMKDYEKDGNRQMALKIAATCVNAVQLSLRNGNEQIEEQERIQMTGIEERENIKHATTAMLAPGLQPVAQTVPCVVCDGTGVGNRQPNCPNCEGTGTASA